MNAHADGERIRCRAVIRIQPDQRLQQRRRELESQVISPIWPKSRRNESLSIG